MTSETSEAERQSELDERSPSWVARRLRDETTPPEYSDLHEYAPELPFKSPKWTGHNGWKKWHAERDCGAETVYIIEDAMSEHSTEEHRAWGLYCARCGSVKWSEVLFIHRDWYYDLPERENGFSWKFLKSFSGLWLSDELVCEAGGVPSSEEVQELIRRSYYETEAQERMAPPMPWEQ